MDSTPLAGVSRLRKRLLASARAAPEPRHAALGADRGARPRARVREPRLPARRLGADRAAVGDEALDRLPARVQGLAPQPPAPAREVHRALLPRRGDRVRRGPPALRLVPTRG